MDLVERWDRLVAEVGWSPGPATAVRQDLFDRYRQPHRHYHTLVHIQAVLQVLDALSAEPIGPAARLAVWFHDAVYEGVAGADEEASAQLAEQVLDSLGTPASMVESVAAIVRATAGHAADTDQPDAETALVLDADLAILAAEPVAYDQYVEQVRREYSHVPDERFVQGRKAVLAGLLGRERLYLTPGGQARFEDRARQNLNRELHQLATGS